MANEVRIIATIHQGVAFFVNGAGSCMLQSCSFNSFGYLFDLFRKHGLLFTFPLGFGFVMLQIFGKFFVSTKS